MNSTSGEACVVSRALYRMSVMPLSSVSAKRSAARLQRPPRRTDTARHLGARNAQARRQAASAVFTLA
jgi:hypothetical protein